MKDYLLMLGVVFLLSGCQAIYNQVDSNVTVVEIGNPTVAEVLESNPDADLFLFDKVVSEANIDWVNELELTADEKVGEIQFTTSNVKEFTHETANLLPVGTKIYRAKERGDVLIAGGKYYYQLVEG